MICSLVRITVVIERGICKSIEILGLIENFLLNSIME